MSFLMNLNSKHHVVKNKYWCPTKKEKSNFKNVINKCKTESAKNLGFVSFEIQETEFDDLLTIPNGWKYECIEVWESDKDYQTWLESYTPVFDIGVYKYSPDDSVLILSYYETKQ